MASTQRTGSSWTEQESKSDTGIMGRKEVSERQHQGDFQEERHESEQEKGIMGRVGDMAGSAAERAGHAASTVADQARHAASTVGSGIKSLGETIRQHTPQSGMLATAAESVAGTLESSGTFLQEKGLQGVGDELTACVRNHPVSSVLVSLGAGFLLGTMLARR